MPRKKKADRGTSGGKKRSQPRSETPRKRTKTDEPSTSRAEKNSRTTRASVTKGKGRGKRSGSDESFGESTDIKKAAKPKSKLSLTAKETKFVGAHTSISGEILFCFLAQRFMPLVKINNRKEQDNLLFSNKKL